MVRPSRAPLVATMPVGATRRGVAVGCERLERRHAFVCAGGLGGACGRRCWELEPPLRAHEHLSIWSIEE
jgi:hypothetical protein